MMGSKVTAKNETMNIDEQKKKKKKTLAWLKVLLSIRDEKLFCKAVIESDADEMLICSPLICHGGKGIIYITFNYWW